MNLIVGIHFSISKLGFVSFYMKIFMIFLSDYVY